MKYHTNIIKHHNDTSKKTSIEHINWSITILECVSYVSHQSRYMSWVPPPTVALAMISLPFSCKRPTHEIKTWRDRPAGRRISGPEGSAAGTFGDGEATSRISNGIPLGYLVGGFNPFEKSNWIISPGRGENKKYLKPPLSYANVSVNGVSWFPKK